MERPLEINKSILEGNKKHLSNAGKKGAELTNQIKELKKIREQEDIQHLTSGLENDMREVEKLRRDDLVD